MHPFSSNCHCQRTREFLHQKRGVKIFMSASSRVELLATSPSALEELGWVRPPAPNLATSRPASSPSSVWIFCVVPTSQLSPSSSISPSASPSSHPQSPDATCRQPRQ